MVLWIVNEPTFALEPAEIAPQPIKSEVVRT